MRIADVMTNRVETVPPTMTGTDAWELMRRKGIHHLVVTSGPEVLGVLSSRDAGGRSGAGVRARSSVSDLMTRDVVTITPTETIRKAANVMQGRTLGCLPVREGRRLVGIVTVSDLLRLLGRGADRSVRVDRVAHHRVPHRKVRRPTGVW